MITSDRITPEKIAARFNELIVNIGSVVSPFGEVEGPAEREARIEACRDNLSLFLHTYFPHYGRQADPEFFGEIEDVLRKRNSPQMVLGFRGSAKSSIISLVDAIREIVYGTAHFFTFVSRSREAATYEYLVPIAAELEANPRLRNDFAITRHGEEQDFVACNTRVRSAGIKSFPRGMKHGPWRIDRVRMEDIEDRGNVLSPAMQKKYKRVVTDDIMESVGSGVDEMWSVIFLGNYFSKRSLIHRLRMSGEFVVLTIKALRPLREGEKRSDAIAGEVSTWPERYPTAMLVEKRRKSPVTFAAEWQQEPDDEESMFRREWFRPYRPSDIPKDAAMFAWIDPSSKEDETQDYKAFGIGYAKFIGEDLNLWLADFSLRQLTVNEMIARIIDMQRRHPQVRVWGYEEVGAEAYLTKLINAAAAQAHVLVPLFPVMKNLAGFPWKKDRIPQMQSWMEKGLCFFRAGDDDHERLISQYLDYPDGLNDDGPDFHSGLYRLAMMMTQGSYLL